MLKSCEETQANADNYRNSFVYTKVAGKIHKSLIEQEVMQRYIGIMSGTSMDGVDSAIVETDGQNITLLHSDFYPMDIELKETLLSVCTGQPTNVQTIGELDHRLGHLFADATLQLLTKANISAASITAIGSHGQTVFHSPDTQYPFTMQLGDANIISAKTGITTIADFRRKDMAFGGQGAPLVPAFHQTIFDLLSDSSCVVLNIGGISNISVLQKDQAALGYDTGPGNVLMDAWVHKHLDKPYDDNAEFALLGRVHAQLLQQFMHHGYFQRAAPKSTGRELFNLTWLEQQLQIIKEPISAEDVQATLAEFTAQTIVDQVVLYQQGNTPELLVCGGGAKNPLLMKRLAKLLPQWCVTTTSERGVDLDYMEAMAFAWLAHQTMNRLPGNLPEVTGASQLTSLGAIYPAPEKY